MAAGDAQARGLAALENVLAIQGPRALAAANTRLWFMQWRMAAVVRRAETAEQQFLLTARIAVSRYEALRFEIIRAATAEARAVAAEERVAMQDIRIRELESILAIETRYAESLHLLIVPPALP